MISAAGVFVILALLSMLVVLGSLFGGVAAMTQEGDTARKSSNKMMRLRIVAQGLALLFLFLAYLAR